MSDEKDDKGENTIYGVAVVVIKDGQVIMSRRAETVVFPKKWQFVHGRLHKGEQSVEAAIRLIYDQMDIAINDRMRFKFAKSVENEKEMYFVYLVSLNKDEVPANTCDRFRGDWRTFDLDKASVLDVIDGIRPILRKLLKTKLKYEVYKQNSTGGILTEREARTLAKLGPKMTRLI